MSKAFTKETDTDTPLPIPDAAPKGVKNYVTPTGLAALQDELKQLMRVERPKIVEVVAWAAGNGDRSENGDYLYGKKRLREIDRRVRYLTKQIDSAVQVDPLQQQGLEKVFFGATVEYARTDGSVHSVKIVGIDEVNAEQGKISWLAPLAKALMKAREGDDVRLRTPAGDERIEVLTIDYVIE